MFISILIVIVLTALSAFADSQGFVHASRIWQDDALVWTEVAKSALGFSIGIISFWLVLRYMIRIGIVSAEMQTLGWFTITIIGVALISGDAFRWQTIDKVIAFLVILGIAWLLFHTGE